MSITLEQARQLVEHQTRVLDDTAEPVGTLAQIYVDEDTEEPLWAAVVFEQPSTVETVVPILDASITDGDLVTRYPRSVIETAPKVTAGDELPWVEEERLRAHYDAYAPVGDQTAVIAVTDLPAAP